MTSVRGWFATLLVCAAACAKSPPSSTAVPGGDPNLITREEMRTPVIASMTALEAIRYLRPAFLRTGGPQSFFAAAAGAVQMSQDFGPLRPVSELSALRLGLVYEVRYLNVNEAQLRFGLKANGGPVIVLINNKQP